MLGEHSHQGAANPERLQVIFDHKRDLGGVFGFALVTADRADRLLARETRDKGGAVMEIDLGEVLRHHCGEIGHCGEKAEAGRFA